jgi:hypothetical protein
MRAGESAPGLTQWRQVLVVTPPMTPALPDIHPVPVPAPAPVATASESGSGSGHTSGLGGGNGYGLKSSMSMPAFVSAPPQEALRDLKRKILRRKNTTGHEDSAPYATAAAGAAADARWTHPSRAARRSPPDYFNLPPLPPLPGGECIRNGSSRPSARLTVVPACSEQRKPLPPASQRVARRDDSPQGAAGPPPTMSGVFGARPLQRSPPHSERAGRASCSFCAELCHVAELFARRVGGHNARAAAFTQNARAAGGGRADGKSALFLHIRSAVMSACSNLCCPPANRTRT